MEEKLTLGDLTIYPEEFYVERRGKPVKLRKKEYQLLELLAMNKNKVMNRNTLLEYVWNYNIQTMTNTLEVHMSSLRRKIDAGYENKMLQTVHGLGYKLCDNSRSEINAFETGMSGQNPILQDQLSTSSQHPTEDLS